MVEHVKGDISVVVRGSRGKLAGPVERSVQRNVTRADKEDSGGHGEESERGGRAVIEELVSDHGVQEQDPTGCRDGGHVHRGEALIIRLETAGPIANGRLTNLPDCLVEWKTTDREDFTYLNDDESQEEQLNFPARSLSASCPPSTFCASTPRTFVPLPLVFVPTAKAER